MDTFFIDEMQRITDPASFEIASMARDLKAQGRDVINLAIGEPRFPISKHIKDAAKAAIDKDECQYTNVDGMAPLKEAIKEKLHRENGLTYKTDQISVGAGAVQVLYNALRVTIRKGDEVIIPAPYWEVYSYIVEHVGGTPDFVKTRADEGFKITPHELEKAITPHTKWLMFNSPNNPSGATYSEQEMGKLAQVLERYPHIKILSDEVYEHLIYTKTPFVSFAAVNNGQLYDRTLTVNSFSKTYGMTGWRVGYGAGSKDLIDRMRVAQNVTTMCPSAPSQAAAVAAYNGPQDFIAAQREVFSRRLDECVDILNKTPGLRSTKPEGAFYLYVNCKGVLDRLQKNSTRHLSDKDVVKFILNHCDVAASPGQAYGMSPYFRLSGGEERVVEACERIRTCFTNPYLMPKI